MQFCFTFYLSLFSFLVFSLFFICFLVLYYVFLLYFSLYSVFFCFWFYFIYFLEIVHILKRHLEIKLKASIREAEALKMEKDQIILTFRNREFECENEEKIKGPKFRGV